MYVPVSICILYVHTHKYPEQRKSTPQRHHPLLPIHILISPSHIITRNEEGFRLLQGWLNSISHSCLRCNLIVPHTPRLPFFHIIHLSFMLHITMRWRTPRCRHMVLHPDLMTHTTSFQLYPPPLRMVLRVHHGTRLGDTPMRLE